MIVDKARHLAAAHGASSGHCGGMSDPPPNQYLASLKTAPVPPHRDFSA